MASLLLQTHPSWGQWEKLTPVLPLQVVVQESLPQKVGNLSAGKVQIDCWGMRPPKARSPGGGFGGRDAVFAISISVEVVESWSFLKAWVHPTAHPSQWDRPICNRGSPQNVLCLQRFLLESTRHLKNLIVHGQIGSGVQAWSHLSKLVLGFWARPNK